MVISHSNKQYCTQQTLDKLDNLNQAPSYSREADKVSELFENIHSSACAEFALLSLINSYTGKENTNYISELLFHLINKTGQYKLQLEMDDLTNFFQKIDYHQHKEYNSFLTLYFTNAIHFNIDLEQDLLNSIKEEWNFPYKKFKSHETWWKGLYYFNLDNKKYTDLLIKKIKSVPEGSYASSMILSVFGIKKKEDQMKTFLLEFINDQREIDTGVTGLRKQTIDEMVRGLLKFLQETKTS